MSYTAVQNTPIVVDLIAGAKDNGWSVSGNIATHTLCNSGNIKLLTYPLIAGHTYQVSYSILTISGGILQLHAGNTTGISRTTTGLFVETITATGTNPELYFYSNANCTVQQFNVGDTIVSTSNKQQNTICYAAVNNKWSDFRTFAPDFGFSLFVNTYTLYQGNLYKHQNGGTDRNNFYGTQYQSILRFVDNVAAAVPKTFLSLSMQVNELMITTTDGITTSLGQVSELAEADFLKTQLSDGVSQVAVFDSEGVFSASFLRDKNVNLLSGDCLKGGYIVIELITTQNTILNLFSVNVVSNHSAIGSR